MFIPVVVFNAIIIFYCFQCLGVFRFVDLCLYVCFSYVWIFFFDFFCFVFFFSKIFIVLLCDKNCLRGLQPDHPAQALVLV